MEQEQYSRTGASTPVFMSIAGNIFHAAIVVFGLCAAYLLYGVFFGLGDFGSWDKARQATMVGNITLAGKGILIASVVGSLCTLILFWYDETAGYITTALGAALYFGVPMAFASLGGETSAALNLSVSRFPLAALAPGVAGIILVIRDIILRIINSVERQTKVASDMQFGKDAKREDRPTRLALIGKCWEGAYCRDFVRQHCPIFIQKDTCWKRRRGCYCDEEIVNAASKKTRGTVLEMAPNEAHNYTSNTKKKAVFLSSEQKAERCRNCIIYNEHQREKYKILLPVTIVICVGLCFLLGVVLRESVGTAMNMVETTVKRFAFTGEPGTFITVSKPNETAQWAFVAAGSIVVIAKVIHALEWVIFEKKL